MRMVLIASPGNAALNAGFLVRDVDVAVVSVDPECSPRTEFFIEFDPESVVSCNVAVRFQAGRVELRV